MTTERWIHIVENHNDLAGYFDEILNIVENPEYIIQGYNKSLIALKRMTNKKFLSVVYKEIDKKDGFIITAYFTSKINIEEEVIIWQQPKSDEH